jgi:hypothetical protein
MCHFKNISLNMGFAELPSKHGPHRSFASENVFPVLSLRKRTVELSTKQRRKKTHFHSCFFHFSSLSYPHELFPSQRSSIVGSSKEGLMVCGGGEAWPWSSPPNVVGGCPSPRLKVAS